MTFYIIGIGNRKPNFTSKQRGTIQQNYVFSGGKRHYELVKEFLPRKHQWIAIQSPMSGVFEAYEKIAKSVVVFASGNPLFYGFSNTLRNHYPTAKIITESYFSSIQLLANATNTNSNQLETVSVHGRAWYDFDTILMQQKELIGVLTDVEKGPSAIAQRMLEYGYTNYEMVVGEDIEGDQEQFYQLSVTEAITKSFYSLNCVLLKKTRHREIDFGISDIDFKGLLGRPNMITKMPVRLTTLHLMQVLNINALWDVGFCTGSISIEAKLKNPSLEIVAFEKRTECEHIMIENQKRFGAPGIQLIMGDFFEQDLSQFSKPDAVFIGGHGGRLEELLFKIAPLLKSDTTIVINAVKEHSINMFRTGCSQIGYAITDMHQITLDNHNSITLLKANKESL